MKEGEILGFIGANGAGKPTLGLAPVILDDISDGIEEIRDTGVTVVLCEQSVTVAMDHAERVYLLENGRFEREGDPAELRGDDDTGKRTSVGNENRPQDFSISPKLRRASRRSAFRSAGAIQPSRIENL